MNVERQTVKNREGERQRVSLTLILSQVFLSYQGTPDMGEKHVPTMHCDSSPSTWKEPLTLSAERLAVPVQVAVCLSGFGKIFVRRAQ